MALDFYFEEHLNVTFRLVNKKTLLVAKLSGHWWLIVFNIEDVWSICGTGPISSFIILLTFRNRMKSHLNNWAVNQCRSCVNIVVKRKFALKGPWNSWAQICMKPLILSYERSNCLFLVCTNSYPPPHHLSEASRSSPPRSRVPGPYWHSRAQRFNVRKNLRWIHQEFAERSTECLNTWTLHNGLIASRTASPSHQYPWTIITSCFLQWRSW